jgi:gas vesicle protein
MSDTKFWIAFGAGVGVGIAVALYGPKAAKTTRKQLHEGLDTARDYVDSTGKVIKKAADRYSRQAEDVLHDATRTVKTVVDRASGAVKTVTDLVA